MTSLLLIDDADPAITVLTLNRPEKRNALNLELVQQLRDAFGRVASGPSRRAVILTAAGPVFCAGMDLGEVGTNGGSSEGAQDRGADADNCFGEALADLYYAIRTCPLVTIAAVQGSAFGGGAGLVAACDFALIADSARIGYPEVTRGLVPALVSCLVRRQVSDRTLREILLLGQTVDGPEALRLGLVNRVVRASSLMDAAIELAREACQGAPGAIASTKELLDRLGPLRPDLDAALGFHHASRHSLEAREGIAAFRERRLPRWR